MKMQIPIPILIGTAMLMSFIFGYMISSNKEKISYDLYRFTKGNIEMERTINSPSDRVSEDLITVSENKIEIDIQDVEWSSYAPTGSMEPTLSETANGLYVKPKGPEDIKVGDIIAYSSEGHSRDIVHRVVEINKDEYGNYYYVTKGDANPVPDPEPVEFDMVKRVLIGIIY